MRCINSRDYWGLHPESQNWWRWCLPLKTARGRNKGKHHKWQQGPSQLMSDLQGAEPLRGGRRGASVKGSLTKVREAHQKALATAAALEEKIEQLSCPHVRSWPEVQAYSRSRDCHRHRSRGQRRKHCQVPPILSITPPKGAQSLAERQWPPRIPIWRNCQNWGQRSPAFSGGQLGVLRRRMTGYPLPKPPMEKLQRGGWCGSHEPTKHLAGGGSWRWYQGWTTTKSWHGRCRPLFDFRRGWVNYTRWRTTSRPHLHCHVFSRRTSCCHLTLSLLVGTLGKSIVRRWWHMPELSSSGQRRLICLLEGNHACWWGV